MPSLHFVGVDLAWGELKPTGVAVVDDAGRLVHVSSQTDDASIEAVLAPYVAGPCLVAVDAPLVVENPTGNRPAETALNRDFARFDAGAHPANTGKPEFAVQPRGARLADRLGLDIDPGSSSRRRAIEVYPHAAMVSLFGLGRTLKY
jgi:predicted RNase H-like nuclease